MFNPAPFGRWTLRHNPSRRPDLREVVGYGYGLALNIAPEHSIVRREFFQYDDVDDNHRWLLKHRQSLSQILTHRFPVDEIPHAFELFFGGETGKVVIEQ